MKVKLKITNPKFYNALNNALIEVFSLSFVVENGKMKSLISEE